MSGQRGVIVGIGGRPAWLELMPSPRVLATFWSAILDAALLDGQLAPRRSTPGQAARDFAAATRELPLHPVGLAGDGTTMTATAGSLTARGIGSNTGQLLHTLTFDADHRLWEDS